MCVLKSRLRFCAFFRILAVMVSHQLDMNIPAFARPFAVHFLDHFFKWLQARKPETEAFIRLKPGGTHLTDFWLYARVGATRQSQVQFGCTDFARVNPVVHAYVKGKSDYKWRGYDLLDEFMPIFAAQWAAPVLDNASLGPDLGWLWP